MPPTFSNVTNALASIDIGFEDSHVGRIIVCLLLVTFTMFVVRVWRRKSQSGRNHWTNGSAIAFKEPIGEKQDLDTSVFMPPLTLSSEESLLDHSRPTDADGALYPSSGQVAAMIEQTKTLNQNPSSPTTSSAAHPGPWRRDSYPHDTVAQRQADHVESFVDQETGRSWRRRTLLFGSDQT